MFTEVGADDHFEDHFDDQARNPITKGRPPFQGSYIPKGALKRQPNLGSFNGKSVKGVWQLVIEDLVANAGAWLGIDGDPRR